jgi:hypothetical protein
MSGSRKGTAPAAGGIFFPQREALGLDARALTPALTQRIIYAASESRSFARAALVLQQVGGNEVSAKTIERVTLTVGKELAELRDAEPGNNSQDCVFAGTPPKLAVVEADGGRIRTRSEDCGPGVHGQQWRETKNACLLRMTHQTFEEDPHPELPRAFCDPEKVAKLAEKEPLSGLAMPQESALEELGDCRPKRVTRTCVSSMADSHEFGRQMEREARRRGFFEALARAFLGDGLAWNWSIQRAHFPDFIPILDFIHPLGYLYAVATVMASDAQQIWSCYIAMARACWQGRVDQVTAALEEWLLRQGIDAAHPLDDSDPRQAVATALRYLTNNRERMDYPRYRRLGLPVTSALMESLVKEVNYRVKGTEKFWNDPSGAEAILQVRAAALCDDDRLASYLASRPGCAYVRRPAATAV